MKNAPFAWLQSVPRTLALMTLSACALSACSPDLPPDDGNGPPEPAEVLTVTLGPAGGELVAGEDSALAGFRLVVPAGALTEEVMLEVQGTVDEAPLLPPAFAVGPQIVIRPAGLVFAVPVQVTAPFDSSLRSVWDAPDEECRVWYREGAGWSRAEQIGSTPTSVTVELSSTTTLGAGVFRGSAPLGCRFDCTPAPAPVANCLDGDRLCIERIGSQHVNDLFDYFSLTQGVLYWVNAPATGSVALAGFDVLSRMPIATSGTAVLDSTSVPAGHVSIDGAGARWLGFARRANVRFEGTRIPTLFDTTATTRPIGVVIERGTREAMRFRYATVRNTAGTRTNSIVTAAVSGTVRGILTAQDAASLDEVLHPGRASVDASYLVWGAGYGEATTAGTSCSGCERPARTACGASGRHSLRAMTVAPASSAWAAICQFVGGGGALLVSGAVRTTFADGQVPSGRLALDSRGAVYLIEPAKAQLTRFGTDGSVTVIPLTSAASTSPEYTAMRPVTIQYDSGLDTLFIVTLGSGDGRLGDIHAITSLR